MARQEGLNALLARPQQEELFLLVSNIIEILREHIQLCGNVVVDDPVALAKPIADLLAVFDQWKVTILQRIGEVLNSPNSKYQDRGSSSRSWEPAAANCYPVHSSFPLPSTLVESLDERQCQAVLMSVLLLLLSLREYSSESRVLMHTLCASLDLSPWFLIEAEKTTAHSLMDAFSEYVKDSEHYENANNADLTEILQKRERQSLAQKYATVGLGAIGGALMLGLTGGLAAPLIASGLGVLFMGVGLGASATALYLGALAASPVAVGALFGIYGGKYSYDSMVHWTSEISDFNLVPILYGGRRARQRGTSLSSKSSESSGSFVVPQTRARLSVTLVISGWLDSRRDVTRPWTMLDPSLSDCLALQWEVKALLNLGRALNAYMKKMALALAKSQLIKHTMLSALTTAMWPLALLNVASIIDNPWNIAADRARKAGLALADTLRNHIHGHRPVTLIGYSLGARVIYYCLLDLVRTKSLGIVENAVLIGAPTPTNKESWALMRSITAGRLVNVYIRSDFVLQYIYRAQHLEMNVAGLCPVSMDVDNVENFDVSDLVSGHLEYADHLGEILRDRVQLIGLISEAEEARIQLDNASFFEDSRNHDSSDEVSDDSNEEYQAEVMFDAEEDEPVDAAQLENEIRKEMANSKKKSSENLIDL
ncbi:hypothetical protein CANCADRAFT_132607 [Tortispora caseinolytica NRRL Y-17796]|uniref:DUF726 domain-containing protein n=1 Tax=Tortispora caseinolytica NRRL Y-17796 TaxID=767744 RepID=A0A1E4TB40_9ASCO|nr:hypothetical protein CANCADRAFT_132607 [Tortispora caseinolytica NRRL Y-17796]